MSLGQCLSCRYDTLGHSCQGGDDVNIFPCIGSSHEGDTNQRWTLRPCRPADLHSGGGEYSSEATFAIVSELSGLCVDGSSMLMAACACEPPLLWRATGRGNGIALFAPSPLPYL